MGERETAERWEWTVQAHLRNSTTSLSGSEVVFVKQIYTTAASRARGSEYFESAD